MQPKLRKGWLNEYCTKAQADSYIKQMIDNFLLPIARNTPTSLISEKTPANIEVFADLAELYPDAYFIQLLRDPRAIVASMLKVGRRARKKGIQTQGYTRSIAEAASYLSKCYAYGMAFQSRKNAKLLTIKYEDLVKNPEALTRRICEFLDLPWDSRMLRPDQYEHAGKKRLPTTSGTARENINVVQPTTRSTNGKTVSVLPSKRSSITISETINSWNPMGISWIKNYPLLVREFILLDWMYSLYDSKG